MMASPSASEKRMHTAYTRRRRCRGTYYKGFVLAYVKGFAERLGCSFSSVVNLLLEKVIETNLAGSVEECLGLEVKRLQLMDEEVDLRRTLNVILRSGAYLPQYAEKLFGGESPTFLKESRLPLPALTSVKEQDIVRRILARREKVVSELLEIEDKLLPEERFMVGLEETGWTTRSNRPRGKKTGRSNQQTGGEET